MPANAINGIHNSRCRYEYRVFNESVSKRCINNKFGNYFFLSLLFRKKKNNSPNKEYPLYALFDFGWLANSSLGFVHLNISAHRQHTRPRAEPPRRAMKNISNNNNNFNENNLKNWRNEEKAENVRGTRKKLFFFFLLLFFAVFNF